MRGPIKSHLLWGQRVQFASAFITCRRNGSYKVKGPTLIGIPSSRLWASNLSLENTYSRGTRRVPNYMRMQMMSTTGSRDPLTQLTLDSLNNEEKSIYQELFVLSEKIRELDTIYYGSNTADGNPNDFSYSEVSDEEYDALARKEAEICTTFPHLLMILERETGLGSKATRFGGRVGQVYLDRQHDNKLLSKNQTKTTQAATGSAAKKRIKRQHLLSAPMQSLDNAMDDVEAVAWFNRVRKLLLSAKQVNVEESSDSIEFPVTVFAEPKIDGLSLSLRYELQNTTEASDQINYNFVWAATRGDGSQGEDVTDAVKKAWMKTSARLETERYYVPNTITINLSTRARSKYAPSIIEIRGEVVLPQASFAEFTREEANTANVTSFSNARNAASGILLRSKDPTSHEELKRTRWFQSRLRFYAYDIAMSSTNKQILLDEISGSNMKDMRRVLTDYGFEVPDPIISETLLLSSSLEFNSSDVSNLLEYHRMIMTSRDESNLQTSTTTFTSKLSDNKTLPPYQVDGVVYKLFDFNDRKICGSTSRTPRWAIAHKFPPLSAVTRLLDIEIQIGRTGALTPVAILEPIDLGGVLVSRASLHNFYVAKNILLPTNCKKLDSESCSSIREGTLVLVSRAGDVIPQVKKRIFNDANKKEIDSIKDAHEMKLINIDPPAHCPACGSRTTFEFVSSPLQQRSGKKKNATTQTKDNLEDHPNTLIENTDEQLAFENENGQVLRCSGPQLLCQPRAINAMAHAYSRTGLDVKGISKSRLQQLMEHNVIRYPADLFLAFGGTSREEGSTTEEMLQKIAELPGWGTISSQNLADSIKDVTSEGVSLSRYIYSLGIPFIGMQASQLIATSYRTIDSFLHALEDASNFEENNTNKMPHPFILLTGDETSEKVKGIGPVALASLLVYSKEKLLVQAAKDLAKSLIIHDESQTQRDDLIDDDSTFKDMTIVFTGKLPISRTAAQNAVKSRGAKSTPSTISKSTSLVVVGEKGGKKARQAEEIGVQVMEASDFMTLIS